MLTPIPGFKLEEMEYCEQCLNPNLKGMHTCGKDYGWVDHRTKPVNENKMEKKYKLLKDNNSPFNFIKAGVVKTESQWSQTFMVPFSEGEIDGLYDWFELVKEREIEIIRDYNEIHKSFGLRTNWPFSKDEIQKLIKNKSRIIKLLNEILDENN